MSCQIQALLEILTLFKPYQWLKGGGGILYGSQLEILKYILLIKVVLEGSSDAKFTFQVVWT